MLCNYLQNVAAITYIFVLQLSTFLFYNKQVPAVLYRSWLRFRLNTNDYALSKDIIRQAHRYLGEQSIYKVVKKDYRLATAIDVASPDLLDLALRSFWSSCNGAMDQEFRTWYARQPHSTDHLATMQLF